MDNKITMDCIIHEHRNTESWVIKENSAQADLEKMLIGAHLNIHDYFGRYPILAFNIDHKPQKGKVFQDVYILEPQDVPEENACFLANGLFLRHCLPKEVQEDGTENMHPIHTLDGIQLVLSSPDSIQQLAGMQKTKDCLIIGVYGEPNPIHFSRGC